MYKMDNNKSCYKCMHLLVGDSVENFYTIKCNKRKYFIAGNEIETAKKCKHYSEKDNK